MYVVLAGICLYFQLQHRQQSKGGYVLIVYTCAMFVSSTIYFCFGAKWSEIEFVETTANTAAFASALSSQLAITKDTASCVTIWLADSLIVCSSYSDHLKLTRLTLSSALPNICDMGRQFIRSHRAFHYVFRRCRYAAMII